MRKIQIIPALSISLALLLFSLSVATNILPGIPVGLNDKKEIHDALSAEARGTIVETRWSPFGQTDLVAYEDLPERMDMYIDGTAGTPMYRFNGNFENPEPHIESLKREFPGYFPFIFLGSDQKDNALVIGPGGGRDILINRMGGIRKVTAVEVNGQFVDVVRKYSDYNGDIYSLNGDVEVITDEGRSYLKRHRGAFDVIYLSLPWTNTSRSPEGYAITENFLLTVDSIKDYMDHLTEEGALIVVTHGDVEVTRLLGISLKAFNERGIRTTEAMRHLYVVGSDDYPLFVLKKRPLTRTEGYTRYREAVKYGYNMRSSFFPGCRGYGSCNPALMTLESGERSFEQIAEIVERIGYDVSTVSDNNPFFFKFERGYPRSVRLIFGLSLVLLLLAVFSPIVLIRSKKYVSFPMRGALVFAALGTGFMLVEISLTQRFVLFLGHPILSLAVLLFSILIGAGIGSLASASVKSGARLSLWFSAVSAFIVLVLMGYTFLLSFVFDSLLGYSLTVRICVSVVMLSFLGFTMGFPFPLMVRWLRERGDARYIPWMWGINGISSVLGSAATILIAIAFGFREALLAGATCYLFASVVIATEYIRRNVL